MNESINQKEPKGGKRLLKKDSSVPKKIKNSAVKDADEAYIQS